MTTFEKIQSFNHLFANYPLNCHNETQIFKYPSVIHHRFKKIVWSVLMKSLKSINICHLLYMAGAYVSRAIKTCTVCISLTHWQSFLAQGWLWRETNLRPSSQRSVRHPQKYEAILCQGLSTVRLSVRLKAAHTQWNNIQD